MCDLARLFSRCPGFSFHLTFGFLSPKTNVNRLDYRPIHQHHRRRFSFVQSFPVHLFLQAFLFCKIHVVFSQIVLYDPWPIHHAHRWGSALAPPPLHFLRPNKQHTYKVSTASYISSTTGQNMKLLLWNSTTCSACNPCPEYFSGLSLPTPPVQFLSSSHDLFSRQIPSGPTHCPMEAGRTILKTNISDIIFSLVLGIILKLTAFSYINE